MASLSSTKEIPTVGDRQYEQAAVDDENRFDCEMFFMVSLDFLATRSLQMNSRSNKVQKR